MRILLCLNRDLMSAIALNQLIPMLKEHRTTIVLSESVGKSNSTIPELQFLEKDFINQVFFPFLELQYPNLIPGKFLTFKQVEQHYQMPIYQFSAINSAETLELIKNELQPDLVISIRYGQIFKKDFIATPRYGVINLHSAILPSYRGILGTFQAIRSGEKNIGSTLHYIVDAGIDTGPVIEQHFMPYDKEQSLIWHVASLYEGGTQMIMRAVEQITLGKTPSCIVQNNSNGTYYSYPTLEQIQEFRSKGYKIADTKDYNKLLGYWL